MSSPQIPNLNSLRRGGLRGRRGSPLVGGGRKSNDEIIQETDHDAASSRLSAVDAGYLDDLFAKSITITAVQRRLPLMNRGTYVRTIGIDMIVDTFTASQIGRKQIVCLGAGSDTRYFRLKQKHSDLDLIYHEIDFEVNTRTKIETITSPSFAKLAQELCLIDVKEFRISNGNLVSTDYYIHAQDLRSLPESLPGVDVTLPTLIISECCLIYLSPDEADCVVKYFLDLLSDVPLAITVYEPIRPSDSFGRTMVRNLTTRGIHLQTLERYADLTHQRERLQGHRFESRAEDVYYIWRNWIEDSEKERVEGLEWMDEIEEFVLLGQHYCISWGWKGWTDDARWRELPATENAQQK